MAKQSAFAEAEADRDVLVVTECCDDCSPSSSLPLLLPNGVGGRLFAVFALVFLGVSLSSTTPTLAKSYGAEKTLRLEAPKFSAPIGNVSAQVGREAIMTCIVDDLGGYKVAWLRVDTQTILTIEHHVITKNHRVTVSDNDKRTWFLHIKDVRVSDRGWYMCQINTDPMKSQNGYLDIVVPPDILDDPTSSDLVVREKSNATLHCAAKGSPEPTITWKREDGHLIVPAGRKEQVEGNVFHIPQVTREQMGAYLCIASNGVPPSVSKRIQLKVEFPPSIQISQQLLGATLGRPLILGCLSEAFPKPINYWVKNGQILVKGEGVEMEEIKTHYQVHMKLTIKRVTKNDFGEYKCVSKNGLGETEESIEVSPRESQESSWDSHPTNMSPKHGKVGKHRGRPIDNVIEIPDPEESTASSASNICSSLVILKAFLVVITTAGPLSR